MYENNMDNQDKGELHEKVIQINRTSKKTKGGDRMGFTSLAVVGDRNGNVGVALSHAPIVLSAVKKSTRKAKKQMHQMVIVGEARTIPHRVNAKSGASMVMLKPAPSGTGVRAGGPVRAVLQAAGYQNIVAKILGSKNIKGNVDATLKALSILKKPDSKIVGKSKKKVEEKVVKGGKTK
jgi:small subunit ribosomal protein S5